jgi:putative GTP pyrophosphokinase
MDSFNWDAFLQPYELAISGFILKLESMKKQFIVSGIKNPIEMIVGRVKTPTSIIEKAKRLGVEFSQIPEMIQDIGGIRITCKYTPDVYNVFELLKSRKDIEIVLVKDYIKQPKPSGYRSLHIIGKYNVETINGQKSIYVEFQVRTLAMHLWASIEHSLKYKYYHNIPDNIRSRLQAASKITAELDNEMNGIQEEVEKFRNGNSREEYEFDWGLNNLYRGKV